MMGLPSLHTLDRAQSARIWLATEATDMRCGFDRGQLFVFHSRRGDRLKILLWDGDVADLVEPLYELMGERVRQSHVVATDDTILPMLTVGKTQAARMWVYVGDTAHPYNVLDFTLNRGRDGPKYFLRDYGECYWPMPMEDTTAWW